MFLKKCYALLWDKCIIEKKYINIKIYKYINY